MSQINQNVTYTKAVGIILMVFLHSIDFYEYVIKPISMFHMPLFFIMSGYCLKEKYFRMPLYYIWRKVKTLWWVYVKYVIIFILLHNIFCSLYLLDSHYWSQYPYTNEQIVRELMGVFVHMENHELLLGQFWFVKSLFIASLIAFSFLYIVNRVEKKYNLSIRQKTFCFSVLIMGGAFFTMTLNYMKLSFTSFNISPREFLAALFIIIGYSMKELKVRLFPCFMIGISIILIFVNTYFAFYGLMKDDFHKTINYIPYIITAVTVTWSIYSLPWHKLCNSISKVLLYIGNNTLPILIWHVICFKLVSFLIIVLFGLPCYELGEFQVIFRYADKGWFVLYTIVGVFVPLIVKYYFVKVSRTLMEKNN